MQGVSDATMAEVEAVHRSGLSEDSSLKLKEVLVLERLIWQALDSIAVLAAKAKKVVREVLLPPAILRLRPADLRRQPDCAEEQQAASSAREVSSGMAASASNSSGTFPSQSVQKDHLEEGLYPSLRRAQRLAYSLATMLPETFDYAEGRQVRISANVHRAIDVRRCHGI